MIRDNEDKLLISVIEALEGKDYSELYLGNYDTFYSHHDYYEYTKFECYDVFVNIVKNAAVDAKYFDDDESVFSKLTQVEDLNRLIGYFYRIGMIGTFERLVPYLTSVPDISFYIYEFGFDYDPTDIFIRSWRALKLNAEDISIEMGTDFFDTHLALNQHDIVAFLLEEGVAYDPAALKARFDFRMLLTENEEGFTDEQVASVKFGWEAVRMMENRRPYNDGYEILSYARVKAAN